MLTTSSVNLLVGSSVIQLKIPAAAYDEYLMEGKKQTNRRTDEQRNG